MGVGLVLFFVYLYHLFKMRQQIYTAPLYLCVDSVEQGSYLSPRTDYAILTRKQVFPRGKGLEFSSELRTCVKVEVAVLCSRSLTVLMVSVDVKQQ